MVHQVERSDWSNDVANQLHDLVLRQPINSGCLGEVNVWRSSGCCAARVTSVRKRLISLLKSIGCNEGFRPTLAVLLAEAEQRSRLPGRLARPNRNTGRSRRGVFIFNWLMDTAQD